VDFLRKDGSDGFTWHDQRDEESSSRKSTECGMTDLDEICAWLGTYRANGAELD
jgi:hypothetical protein